MCTQKLFLCISALIQGKHRIWISYPVLEDNRILGMIQSGKAKYDN